MYTFKLSLTRAGCLIAAICVAPDSAWALSGVDAYSIDWYTIDGGGGSSAGGSFSLDGTIGQHDAGGPLTGGGYSLNGGFWVGAAGAAPCPADFDADGEVDFDDFTQLLAEFGSVCPCETDLDGDGNVDFDDFTNLLANFGPCP